MDQARISLRDGFLARLGRGPLLMGILNVTPDSFSDGGRFDGLEAARAQAVRMVAEGADIVDIGGESTRPGHAPVGPEEEAARVLPVIAALAGDLAVPLSIDTYKAATARAAVAAGAVIVNDVWGLQKDPEMPAAVAETGAAVVVMHNRETADPGIDIFDDMDRFFGRSLTLAQAAGVPEGRIILDPGIGFGKTAEQSIACIAGLDRLKAHGLPVLLGLSRKSFIGKVTGAEVGNRLTGTLVANMIGLEHGAAILRVHDVAEHLEMLKMVKALEGNR